MCTCSYISIKGIGYWVLGIILYFLYKNNINMYNMCTCLSNMYMFIHPYKWNWVLGVRYGKSIFYVYLIKYNAYPCTCTHKCLNKKLGIGWWVQYIWYNSTLFKHMYMCIYASIRSLVLGVGYIKKCVNYRL